MWPHFVNILGASWSRVTSELGTTTLSVVLFSLAAPVATFIITMLVVRRSEGGFMEHVRKSAIPTLIGLFVPLVLIGCVFFWSTVRSIYVDHRDLVAQARRLRDEPKPTCPRCPECLQKSCKGNTLIESKNSLRRRTLLLVKELNEFWGHKPIPVQQPVQNASTEEDRQRNAAWDQYWRDAKAAYLNADYRHRLIGIIRSTRIRVSTLDTWNRLSINRIAWWAQLPLADGS